MIGFEKHYPCGAHTHASERARQACQGEGIVEDIPELGLRGKVWALREKEKRP